MLYTIEIWEDDESELANFDVFTNLQDAEVRYAELVSEGKAVKLLEETKSYTLLVKSNLVSER